MKIKISFMCLQEWIPNNAFLFVYLPNKTLFKL